MFPLRLRRIAGRVLAGGPERRSRLHDEKGHRIDLAGLRFLPHAAASALLLRLAGRRPPIPWLSYRAIAAIDRLLGPGDTVLEFGSGMSTLWFARRCRRVHSIEHHADWHGVVSAMLAQARIANVDQRLKAADDYASVADIADASIDFVLVDGIARAACVREALRTVRPGGHVYLDNSDKHATVRDGDTRIAEALLLAAAHASGGTVRYFLDFAPTQLFVQEGLLAKIGPARSR